MEELSILKSITEHPKLFAAIANDDFVRVLGSQKTLAIVLSGNRSSFLKLPSPSIKLFENSIKYSISNPEIEVKTLNENNQILINVADNGMGMSNKVKSKIFVDK